MSLGLPLSMQPIALSQLKIKFLVSHILPQRLDWLAIMEVYLTLVT